SNGVKTFAPLIVLVLVVGAWLFKKSLDTEKGRYAFDGFVLRVPLVRRISKGANAARFASTLSILSKSGVPLVEALYIAAAVASNWHIRDAILEAAVKVTEGGSISGSLEKSRFFPPMMIQMLRSGETGGELDEMLARSAQMQDRELSSLITTMVGLFEPLMLLVMAGVVLIIVLAIMLPIVSMNSLVH
ncbi:MAG TPA: type II secretion system F family protein, partial [Agitococcus sp.]|nr:type II secretion system F family protein [Agitococcus sp.]